MKKEVSKEVVKEFFKANDKSDSIKRALIWMGLILVAQISLLTYHLTDTGIMVAKATTKLILI